MEVSECHRLVSPTRLSSPAVESDLPIHHVCDIPPFAQELHHLPTRPCHLCPSGLGLGVLFQSSNPVSLEHEVPRLSIGSPVIQIRLHRRVPGSSDRWSSRGGGNCRGALIFHSSISAHANSIWFANSEWLAGSLFSSISKAVFFHSRDISNSSFSIEGLRKGFAAEVRESSVLLFPSGEKVGQTEAMNLLPK
jgi:hypothetical protein